MEENTKYIDLMEYVKKLWNAKAFIIKSIIVGGVVGLIVAFSIPKVYESKVVFAPETSQKLSQGVNSLASMMGVSFDNSVDAISVEMFPDVVKSTPFIFPLFDVQVETRDSLNTTFIDYINNHQKQAWWSYIFQAPYLLKDLITGKPEPTPDSLFVVNCPPREARRVIGYMNENLKIRLDSKTGMFHMSLRMQDPKVAATILEVVMEDLKDYMTDYRTSKNRQDEENLQIILEERRQDYYAAQKRYAEFIDSNKHLVKLSAQVEQQKLQQEMSLAYQVYSQVAAQHEGARIKVQQAKPVFAVLEPVSIPWKKAAPSKAKILFAFVFLAGVFSAAWVLFGKELKKNIETK